MNSPILGLLILVVAGIVNACFTLPMKYTRRWAWENTWLAWTLFALMLLPFIAANETVPHITSVYRASNASVIWEVAGFGAGWGVAQACFGLAVDSIGIALTFSLVLGTSAAVGTLIPLLCLHSGQLNSMAGLGVLSGVGLVVMGVFVCAVAGTRRERALNLHNTENRKATRGLVLAILCGIGASLMNFGVVFGAPLATIARTQGASVLNAENAVWLPLMLGGAAPNLLYCLWLILKNGSGSKFSQGGVSYWGLALMMAVFWFSSTLLYGLSTVMLGVWGAVLGWPLFMSLIVIAASILGMLTNEWKDCGSAPPRIQWIGVTLLILAVFVLAFTSRAFA